MATRHTSAKQRSRVEIPHKDRFPLHEALDVLKPLGCSRANLFEYLRAGRLRAVCFPYRVEEHRLVPIEAEQWGRMWKDAWEFPVYDGWIGDKDIVGSGELIPLHVVPDSVDADLERKLADGGPAAESAPVYVLREELVRFAKWLANPSKARPGPRRPGAGRPSKHDYSEIDASLAELFAEEGRSAFKRPSVVVAYLKQQLGTKSLPADTTLRNHVASWLAKRLSKSR